jgi:hypothetical protein
MIVMATENHSASELSPVARALLDWAEYWYPISWKGVLLGGVITAVGACATIAFLLLQWRTTSIREEHSEWRTSSLELQTASAKADLGKAQTDIATANENAAKANERAAEAQRQAALLEKETAQARADQERLKSMVVWRSIPKDVGDRIAVRLSARKVTVRLMVLANDPEGMAFASILTRILANAKWEAFAEAGSWVNWLPVGVSVYGPDEDLVRFVLNAFKAEGHEFIDAKPLREPDLYARQDVGGLGDVTILVGARLGPL